MFDRFWWRGRTDQTSFEDGPAPRGAASVAYRVRAKAADGSFGPWTDCQLLTTPGASCQQTASSTGGFELAFDTEPANADDFVVRRQVREGGPYWWRLRTDDRMATDRSSPTGVANYIVWARQDRVIVAAMVCGSTAPTECEPPDRAAAFEFSPPQADPDLFVDIAEFEPIEDSAVGPDGFVYFVQTNAPGQDYVYRLDPASGDLEEWGTVGTTDFFPTQNILAVDAFGGVTTTYANNTGTFWEYSYAGTTTRVTDNFDDTGVYALGNLSDGRVLQRRVVDGIDRFELLTSSGPGADNGTTQILLLPAGARTVLGATTDDRIVVKGDGVTQALPVSCFER